MTMVSLGDLARTLLMQRNMAATKLTIQTLSQEMSTGLTADVAGRLQGNLAPLHALDATLSRLEAFSVAAADLQIRVEGMQASLARLDSSAADLANDLATAESGGAIGLVGMAAAGEAGFLSAVATLNTVTAGRYVFSGMNSDRAPLPVGEDMLAQLRDATAGATTAAELQQRIEDWIDDPARFGYRGAAGATVPLADGENLVLDITAADPALRQTLSAFAMAAMLKDSPLAMEAQADHAVVAGSALRAAQPGLDRLAARMGQAEERIAEVQGRMSAEKAALALARVDMLKIDEFETATRLTAAQDRLDMLFAVTARLSGLKLSDYLR